MPRNIPLKEIDQVKSYMVIELSYSKVIILPYADGIKLLASLEKAELLSSSVHEVNQRTVKFNGDNSVTLDVATVPQRVYREAKLDMLLGLEPKPEEENDD